jgi:alpha-ribazole phosphatase
MVRLILVRHGQTDYSSARRYCGFSDPPLNPDGIRQARRLAAALRDLSIDRVYASDLARAQQTARLVFADAPVEQTADLREMNFGLFEGLTYEQIMEKYPMRYREWVDHPERVKPPHGEGLRDLQKRVRGKIASILARHEGQVVAVVTHGGPVRIVLGDALQLDVTRFWNIQPGLGSWSIIDYAQGMPPAVTAMHGVAHPSSLGAAV